METSRATYLQSTIADLSAKIKIVSQLYNSKDFDGILYIAGKDVNTQVFFSGGIELDQDIPELKDFFNMYGARMIAERMTLQSELKELLQAEDLPNNINA